MQPGRRGKYYALAKPVVAGRLLDLESRTAGQDIRQMARMRCRQVLQDQDCGVEIRLERAYQGAQRRQAAGRCSDADDRQGERIVYGFDLGVPITVAPPETSAPHSACSPACSGLSRGTGSAVPLSKRWRMELEPSSAD